MKSKPVLQLCGLGSQPPEETTCEALQALESCRVVFTDTDAATAAWLRGYAKKLVVLSAQETEAVNAKRISVELGKGGGVGVAVWGHPMLTSPLCRELLRRTKGADIKVPGAVSPIGSAFARSVNFFGGDYGYHAIQACDLSESSKARLDPRMPLVVYSGRPGEHAGWELLAAALRRGYPGKHEAFFYPVGSEGGKIALEQLPELTRISSRAVLLVPPAPKSSLKRTR